MTMPGPMELGLILLIIVIIFGAARLPKLGAGLGRGIRNFKDALSGKDVDRSSENSDPKKLSQKE